jgi:purine-binding chemotaxis protein CheW
MTTGRLLIFRASAHSQGVAALPTERVIETMRPLPLEPLANASSNNNYILGVSIIRGQPTPVIDLSLLLGEEDENKGAASERWITVATGGQRTVALRVHEVIGIRRQNEMEGMGKLAPLVGARAHAAVEKLAVLDGELLLILESARIVAREEIDRLFAAAANEKKEAVS